MFSSQVQAMTCQSMLTDWSELKAQVEFQLGDGAPLNMDIIKGIGVRDLNDQRQDYDVDGVLLDDPLGADEGLKFLEDLEYIEDEFGRVLSDKDLAGILLAHLVGYGEGGKDGGLAGLYNYTGQQLIRKKRILELYGYSREEIKYLMDMGYVGEKKYKFVGYDVNGEEVWQVTESSTTDNNTQGLSNYDRKTEVSGDDVPGWWARFNGK